MVLWEQSTGVALIFIECEVRMSHLVVIDHVLKEYSTVRDENIPHFDFAHILSLLSQTNSYSELFSTEGDVLKKKWFKLIGTLCHADATSREFGLSLLQNSLPHFDHQTALTNFPTISNNLLDRLKVRQ